MANLHCCCQPHSHSTGRQQPHHKPCDHPTGIWGTGQGGTTSKGGRRSGAAPPLPPVPQSSSSVPSMQSASASQRQRMGMQCPFLHWNWSNSQRGVQSFCSGKAGDRGQQGQPPPWQAPAPLLQPGAGPQTPALQVLGLPRSVRGTSGRSGGCGPAPTCRQGGGGAGRDPPPPSTVPHRSHPRSRGPRRTSTCLRCSGHWHTRTRSPSRAEVLGTDRRGETPEHRLRGWQGTLADCRRGNRTIGKLFGAVALGRGWVRSRRAEPRPLPSSSPGLPAGNGVHGGNATATQTRLWQLPAVPGPHTVPPRALLQEGTQQSPGQAWQSPHACAATSQGGGDGAPRWASSWHRADLQDHGTVWCPARDGSWGLSPPQWCRTCQGKHPSWLGEQKPIGVDLGAGGVQAE